MLCFGATLTWLNVATPEKAILAVFLGSTSMDFSVALDCAIWVLKSVLIGEVGMRRMIPYVGVLLRAPFDPGGCTVVATVDWVYRLGVTILHLFSLNTSRCWLSRPWTSGGGLLIMASLFAQLLIVVSSCSFWCCVVYEGSSSLCLFSRKWNQLSVWSRTPWFSGDFN